MAHHVIRLGAGTGKTHYVIHLASGEYLLKGDARVTGSFSTASDWAVLATAFEGTPNRVHVVKTSPRVETDWLDSASLFLPKSMREALMGDLLEERASWRAAGKSRLAVARGTASQLILSALALVWSAAKDVLTDTLKRWLGL